MGLALGGDKCHPSCMRLCKVFTFEKEAIVIGAILILVVPISRLHIELDQLKNKATPQFTLVEILEGVFVYLFMVCLRGVQMVLELSILAS